MNNFFSANTNFQNFVFAETKRDIDINVDSFIVIDSPYEKPNNRILQKLYYRKNIQFLKRFIHENNINIVHVHFANYAYLYKDLKSEKLKYAVSFYGYDYESLSYQNPKWKKAIQEVLKIADLIYCEGPHGVGILKEQSCDEKKLRIQNLGIQKENIQFIKRQKTPKRLKLVQIASFTQKKGQMEAIKAIYNLVDDYPNITLDFFGNVRDQEYYDAVKSLIKEYNLYSYTKLNSYINYSEIAETLGNYDVFIHPSRYSENRDCEGGAPTILFNAQGSGMPVISTRHCDIPNSVIQGKTALLSEEENIKELANNIVHFYEMDHAAYEKYAVNAYNFVAENFDIKKNLASFEYV